ncbi:PAS-domain containing protein [Oceanobacter kriegii]|uniref:PAS-domain containing protein n=1 Tax=Oceanobacter kriegii TaxID=64972 RepID=UPI0004296608|nr:PAS-domain containing protein [Oceanobacter kriegii]
MLTSVRRLQAGTRLLLAFSILAASTLGLALMGWIGLNNTATSVTEFEQQSLPEISRSLELAERTANLAAVAPYVAGVNSPFMLQGLSLTLEDKISHLLALAESLPQLDAATPNLQPLLLRLEHTAKRLIEVTRSHLFAREDLRQTTYNLHQLARELRQPPHSEQIADQCLQITDWLLMAARSPDATELALLQQDVNNSLSRLNQQAWPGHPAEHWLTELQGFSNSSEGVFPLRQQQLHMQEESAFLLASTRAISEQLSDSVTHFVDQTRASIAQRSQKVSVVVASGQTGILIISLLCLAAVAGGIWVVRELGLGLSQITQRISRLASGDSASQLQTDQQPLPAAQRQDEIGELARAFQVFRDNALAMQRISDDLSSQTRLLETVFINMNDGLSVFDADGRLVAWNPGYLTVLKLPKADIRKGMTLAQIHDLLPAEARDSWSQMGTLLDKDQINAARQNTYQRFERHFSDGRQVEFRSSPMPSGGFVTLYSDLTERKAIEAQLQQAQKMEVLGQLTGGVAHDFNNLLAAMFGNLQLLEDGLIEQVRSAADADSAAVSEKALKRLRRAMATAERGNQLTRRLLAFSRKQQLSPSPTHVDALILDMEDLFEYSLSPNIQLQLRLDCADAVVLVDAAQLENALLNLAINANAAMPDGGTLTLTTRYRTASDADSRKPQQEAPPDTPPWLEIVMTDTGCGIEQAHLERVFEPFFTTKDIGEGSGLGLSMVYGFVKQSAGDIEIQSQPGAGTEVTIQLPVSEQSRRLPPVASLLPADQRPLISQPEGHTGLSPQHLPLPESVLLVEDDPQVASATREQLEALGCQCVDLPNAEQAIEWLQQQTQPPALLLTDINLGAGMNGLQLRQQVMQQWPQLPVLLSSGLNQQQLVSRYPLAENVFQQPGASELLLNKPWNRQQLASALRRSLARPAATENVPMGIRP